MPGTRATLALVVASVAALVSASGGCGNRTTSAPPPDKRDAAPADAPAVEVDGLALGLPDLTAYGWRTRGGQPAFRVARAAEDRGDWSQVVTSCRQALATDPGHLEAAWLFAVGLAKLGQLEQVLPPLQRAAAGDFPKWGQASLELPALQPFLATPVGAAWRRRVEQDRRRFGDAVARSAIVTAAGELYAVDADAGRWYRLTRSTGAVIGAIAIPAAHRIAYVARVRRKAAHDSSRGLGVGVIDLAQARSSRPIPLGTGGPIAIAYSERPPAGLWIGTGAPRAAQWRQLDDDYRFNPLPARTARPAGPWLEVTTKGAVRLHALPPSVTADWDEQSLASAIRIGTSNRVISVPSPGLIDGNTAAWSPDRVHLAFVAQLDDHCTAGSVNTAAFVADASTGGTRELERSAGGIALAWLAERKLAIAGDQGVAIHSLDDGVAPVPIDGATGLMIPRERPRCAPTETQESQEDTEPEPAGDEPADAGVADAR